MTKPKSTRQELLEALLVFIILSPIIIYQYCYKNDEKKHLKNDPIEINAVITKITGGGRNSSPKVYYKYIYNGEEYDDNDHCSKLIYKHREDGRKDIHGTTYFSVVGDTFKIIISKSHPHYSKFIHDPWAFKRRYYSNQAE